MQIKEISIDVRFFFTFVKTEHSCGIKFPRRSTFRLFVGTVQTTQQLEGCLFGILYS